jgi:hypothetical protein
MEHHTYSYLVLSYSYETFPPVNLLIFYSVRLTRVEKYIKMEYKIYLKCDFAILHISLSMMFTYDVYKPTVIKPVALQMRLVIM